MELGRFDFHSSGNPVKKTIVLYIVQFVRFASDCLSFDWYAVCRGDGHRVYALVPGWAVPLGPNFLTTGGIERGAPASHQAVPGTRWFCIPLSTTHSVNKSGQMTSQIRAWNLSHSHAGNATTGYVAHPPLPRLQPGLPTYHVTHRFWWNLVFIRTRISRGNSTACQAQPIFFNGFTFDEEVAVLSALTPSWKEDTQRCESETVASQKFASERLRLASFSGQRQMVGCPRGRWPQ